MTRPVYALALFAVVLSASVASAQTPVPRLLWDQPGATLAEAQGYTFTAYIDGSVTGAVLKTVTCVEGVPVVCSLPFPAMSATVGQPNAHTIQISGTNGAGEGLKSAAFSFVLIVVPMVPGNLRLQD